MYQGYKQPQPGRLDARRTPRRVFQRPVGILRAGVYEVVLALQLSEGGMLFQTHTRFAVNDIIVITLVIPGGAAIVTRGEVIYERPKNAAGFPQFGVKFLPLTLQLRRLIRNYVTAKTQAEAEAESVEGEAGRKQKTGT